MLHINITTKDDCGQQNNNNMKIETNTYCQKKIEFSARDCLFHEK